MLYGEGRRPRPHPRGRDGRHDYLAKPFNPARAAGTDQRRAAPHRPRAGLAGHVGQSAARLRFQDWTIDLRLREPRDPEGAQVPLTSAEFDLLQVLRERPGRILTRDGLLTMTRSRPASPFGRSTDVLVELARRKLDTRERTVGDPERCAPAVTSSRRMWRRWPKLDPRDRHAVSAEGFQAHQRLARSQHLILLSLAPIHALIGFYIVAARSHVPFRTGPSPVRDDRESFLGSRAQVTDRAMKRVSCASNLPSPQHRAA